jgi:ABC-type multidrug transport system ATPase subunit
MSFRCTELKWDLSPSFSLSISELVIPVGSTTLILGPSGCGKSTFLALLGRVHGGYFPDWETERPTGTCHLLGQDNDIELISATEQKLLRDRIRGDVMGFMFQQEALFSDLSPLENVSWSLLARGMAPADAETKAHAMLEKVGLGSERETASLSGGERKRLAFARTLVLEPRVLLLDEPFTGLDPQAHSDLLGLLQDYAADPAHTVVMVTHQQKDIASMGDTLVFMENGAIRATGPRDELQEMLESFLNGSVEPGDEV